ncbi:MAG: DinB family protein [Bryobacteraceae bacterium]
MKSLRTEFSLADAVALLTRTPATLDALLRGLPNIWVRRNEGNDTWSALDIVSHLIFAERTDWMPRVRIMLESGEARPFDPFDRFAHLKESQGKSLEQLLDDFAGLRMENLAALRELNLQPEDLTRRGWHPALGAVTLLELLATWAVHDLTHVHQLSRVMAHQYRGAVGPWCAYLGVLQCTGQRFLGDLASAADRLRTTASRPFSRTYRSLRYFQSLQFQPVAANLCKIVLSLLHKPAFLRAAKNLGYSHGHFGGDAALAVYEFRERIARHPKGGGGVRNRQA